tara:strand:+ start:4146 stop:4406 length:261 start_codon:yes stop_codon:yes gene_type:complete
MSWENIVKRSNSDELDKVLDMYSGLKFIVNDTYADMIPFVSLLQNGSLEEANDEWKKMQGNIKDLEGSLRGMQEVNDFITKLLGDA